MTYYRVIDRFDGVMIKNRSLVSGELYTEKELSRYGIPSRYCDCIDLNKNKTFTSFGCRFPAHDITI